MIACISLDYRSILPTIPFPAHSEMRYQHSTPFPRLTDLSGALLSTTIRYVQGDWDGSSPPGEIDAICVCAEERAIRWWWERKLGFTSWGEMLVNSWYLGVCCAMVEGWGSQIGIEDEEFLPEKSQAGILFTRYRCMSIYKAVGEIGKISVLVCISSVHSTSLWVVALYWCLSRLCMYSYYRAFLDWMCRWHLQSQPAILIQGLRYIVRTINGWMANLWKAWTRSWVELIPRVSSF